MIKTKTKNYCLYKIYLQSYDNSNGHTSLDWCPSFSQSLWGESQLVGNLTTTVACWNFENQILHFDNMRKWKKKGLKYSDVLYKKIVSILTHLLNRFSFYAKVRNKNKFFIKRSRSFETRNGILQHFWMD